MVLATSITTYIEGAHYYNFCIALNYPRTKFSNHPPQLRITMTNTRELDLPS